MGKKWNKQKSIYKKDPIATKIAGVRKKSNTKPVLSNLKRLSVQNKNRTAVLDAQFPHMQQPVKPVSHKSKPDDQWTSAEKLSDLVSETLDLNTVPKARKVTVQDLVDKMLSM